MAVCKADEPWDRPAAALTSRATSVGAAAGPDVRVGVRADVRADVGPGLGAGVRLVAGSELVFVSPEGDVAELAALDRFGSDDEAGADA